MSLYRTSMRLTRFLRMTLIASIIATLCFFIGAACVLLPVGIPFVAVGLAAAILLFVLPDLRILPVSFARRMIYVFAFSVIVIPAYYTLIIPGLPWISARRVALSAFGVPLALILAGSARYRRHLLDLLKRLPLIYACLLIFCAAIVLSTALSIHVGDSLGATANMLSGWLLPFIGTLMLLRNARDAELLVKVLVFCLFVDFFLGLPEFYMRKPFLVYAMPPAIRTSLVASNPLYINLFVGQPIRNGLYRAASTYTVALSWGEMAAMIAPLTLHFFAHGRSKIARLFGLLGFAAAFASIVCSGSRGAYVGLIAASISFAIVWAFRLIRREPASMKGMNALFMLGLLSSGVILAVIFVGSVRRYVLGGGGAQSSTDSRWEEWALAKPKILASPFWGYGPGTSGEVIGYYPFGSLSPTVDSYIMTGLVEYGIIGFLALVCALTGLVVVSFRRYLRDSDEQALLGNALGSAVISFMAYRITLSQQENMSTLWLIAGIIYFISANQAKRSSAPQSHRPHFAGTA